MPYALGIENYKYEVNLGTLLRSAYNFNCSMVFTVGRRYNKQYSDTVKSTQKIPVLHFTSWEEYGKHAPMDWLHIAVELTEGAANLVNFCHPKSAVYLLGPEDGSLSPKALGISKYKVVIPTNRCLNLAVAGSILMYDRVAKGSK